MSTENQILPEYFEAFAMYVCRPDPGCLTSSFLVPPPDEQWKVLLALRTLQSMYPIEGYEALVFSFLSSKDLPHLQMLLEAILQIHAQQEIVEDMARIAFP